jgi:hypothetical protein
MVKGAAIGPYNIYSGSYSYGSSAGLKYGVGSGSFADSFKDATALGTVCSTVGTTVPSSTSTSSVSVKTSTSSSATATPTLAHKAVVGAYSYLGCYTEGTNVRALSSAAFYNYTGKYFFSIALRAVLVFSGCSEGNGLGRQFVNSNISPSCANSVLLGMTIEQCMSDCSAYSYFGVEYGGECKLPPQS